MDTTLIEKVQAFAAKAHEGQQKKLPTKPLAIT